MRIAYFITGHGYGHGVRSATVINALSPTIEVYLFTSLSESFFQGELQRPFHYFACEIDCGCIQCDTVTIDIWRTLTSYAAIDARREKLLTEIVPLLQNLKIDLVIGDIPPLAFTIAHIAGIPSLAIHNFTWVDIYESYLAAYPQFSYLLARLREDYAQASHAFTVWPHVNHQIFPWAEFPGLLFRQGYARRELFAEYFQLDPEKKWCLIYIGNHGLEGIAWEHLQTFTDYEFFGLYALENAPNNYHQIVRSAADYRYADLTATADIILGKLGYSLLSECLSLGKPILFLSREDFCEYEVLKQAVLEREQGLEIHPHQLRVLDFRAELDKLIAKSYVPITENALDSIVLWIKNRSFVN